MGISAEHSGYEQRDDVLTPQTHSSPLRAGPANALRKRIQVSTHAAAPTPTENAIRFIVRFQ